MRSISLRDAYIAFGKRRRRDDDYEIRPSAVAYDGRSVGESQKYAGDTTGTLPVIESNGIRPTSGRVDRSIDAAAAIKSVG